MTMNNCPPSSPSLEELGHVPCVLYHRDGGYLCVEPKSKDGGNGAIAYNRSVIPPRKFVLQPKECSSAALPRSKSRRRIRTKNEFFEVLDRIVGEEVSIQDAESWKYLTAERGAYGKLVAKFNDEAQFFCLGRRDNGAYFFRRGPSEKGLYLRKSSKTKDWVMKGSRGTVVNANTSHVNFSSSFDSNGNANDWVIEPDDGIAVFDSLAAEGGDTFPHASVLFLCVADAARAARTDGLEVSYHFRNVPPAWRSKEQWEEAIRSVNAQRLRGDEYCVHADRKNKWIAKCSSEGKLYIVIASSNFHQELLEDCCDSMEAMRTSRRLAAEDLSELGRRVQSREETLTKEENEQSPANQAGGDDAPVYERMGDVRVALLHRSSEWFRLTKDDSSPLSLYLEPVGETRGHEDMSPPQALTTSGNYFARLNQHLAFAIKNEQGHYLLSKERDVIGKGTKLRTKYLIPEFAQLSPGRTPETFAFDQNANTGGISIMSRSNEGYSLTRNKKGNFTFTPSAKEEDHLWFVDTPDLQSGISSEGILFSCIIRQGSKKAVVSAHSPGRPTAWRSEESWDYIVGLLLEEIKEQSSTVVADTDTGYQWFATNPYGKDLFIVVATQGFPLYYGTKALMAMEDSYYGYGETEVKGGSTHCDGGTPSSADLHRIIRGIDTEYRYERCFGNDEVLDLIQEVEDLTDKMRANVEALKENMATAREIEERATELHDLAKQFRKNANKAKYKMAAAAVAGGCVAGGLLGWMVGGPAGAFVLETQAAEIALGASIMAFPGVMRGVMLLSTDKFWKRRFVNFGRCIDSRRRGRARGRKVEDLEGDRADLNVRYCDTWVLVDSPPEQKLV